MSDQTETAADTKPDLDPEVEKQLREAAEAEERLAEDMKQKCRSEFDKRSSILVDQFNASFNTQLSNVGDRYTSQLHETVTNKQTDVLRSNKAIRDVSRDLGADWKPVFLRLMRDHEEGKVRVEVARIERQKPFMQAFKALSTWKDMVGDKFDIRMLTEALMSIDRRDLAEKVLDILDNNEIDSLYAMDGVGTGISGGAAPRRPPQRSEDTDGATGTNQNGETKDGTTPKPAKTPAPAEDPVADRVLLKLAKAFGKDWVPLAEALALTEEQLEETKETGADSYHGGFKALYTWRDNQVEAGQSTQDMTKTLKDALTKVGKADLADTIPS